MKLYVYTGETSGEALRVAQEKHGENALVVKTEEKRKKSLTQPGLYEVTIAVDDGSGDDGVIVEMPPQPPKRSNNASSRLEEIARKEYEKRKSLKNAAPKLPIIDEKSDATSAFSQLSNIVREVSEIANVPSPTQSHTAKDGLKSPVMPESVKMDTKELKAIKTEIDKLNDKLKIIQNMFWDEKSPKEDGLVIPPEFAEIYHLAKSSGMARDHLDKIMRLTLELMPPKMRENSVFIKRYFREVLRKMVFCRAENLEAGAKKIIMFVGPTGVGKTTTLAKMAARYGLMMDKKYKVGIIALDSYRIGAVDQLNFYAKKMGLSIDQAIDQGDFVERTNQLRYCDYILVDTAGISQHDKQRIESLKQYVNSDPNLTINVSLVMSATTKYEDLKDIYHTFSVLDIDTLIFTKLDETNAFGNVFSLVYETKKPLSYFSIGQDVPYDLMSATNEYLVDCLLDGFKKVE